MMEVLHSPFSGHQDMVTPLTKWLAILTLSITSLSVQAQLSGTLKGEVEMHTSGTTNGVLPFWMRSNHFGSIPSAGASGSFVGRISKNYTDEFAANSDKQRKIDWGYGFEGRANGGKESRLILVEAYAKLKLSHFEIKAGRGKDVMGLNGDTSLSTGNFAVSGNSLGVPKIEIKISNYLRIPVFDGLLSIKGNFAHGWLGNVTILDSITSVSKSDQVYYVKNNNPSTYFHQKSLYVRLGKSDWHFQLYGGFSHQAFWGNEKEAYGDNFKLSTFKTFVYVATGRAYGSTGVPRSKIGNQLGSIDLGGELDLENVKILIYRQNFYDVGALSKFANIADGLNGITITNKNYLKTQRTFQIRKLLLEVFHSKNQAGYPWSTPTKSGDEDYYNNFYYLNGWSYFGRGIGSPLITARSDAKPGQAYRRNEFFINNRVIATHFGVAGSVASWKYQSKLTYSWNYGTFGTSKYGSSTGSIREPRTGDLFIPVQQLSIYIDALKELKNGYSLGFNTAFDSGRLLPKSFGGSVRLVKKF